MFQPRAPNQAADTFSLATRRVVRFGVIYAVVVTAVGALSVAGYAAIRSGAADPTEVGTQASVLIVGAVTGMWGWCAFGPMWPDPP